MKVWNYANDCTPAWRPVAVRGKYAFRHQARRLVNAGYTLARLNGRWFAHGRDVSADWSGPKP